MKKRELPLGNQDFKKIIENNDLIVDKTDILNKVLGVSEYLFFARPRRFGKSFLLSQLKYLYLGKKELFKDLFIFDKWNWNETYPVIYCDFSQMSHIGDISAKLFFLEKGLIFIGEEEFTIGEYLRKNLNEEQLKNIHLHSDFGSVAKLLYRKTGKKSAILIDEYDNPVMKNISDEVKFEKIRDDLQCLYIGVKANDYSIKLFFLTGLARVLKMSIFSTMNNLIDITDDGRFFDLLGYSEKDMEKNFGTLFEENKIDKIKIKNQYNGFRFSPYVNGSVYNPWDINNFVNNNFTIKDYWAQTGMISSIVEYIRLKPAESYDILTQITKKGGDFIENKRSFGDYKNIDLVSLLFFSGYLTYKEDIDNTISFSEVRITNNECQFVLLDYLTELTKELNGLTSEKIRKNLLKSNLMLKIFKFQDFSLLKELTEIRIMELVSLIPYEWLQKNPEGVLKSHFYLWMLESGITANAEVESGLGKSDLEINFGDINYVIEFKVNSSTKEAIKQAENQYILKYKDKPLIILGINLNYDSSNKKKDFKRTIQYDMKRINCK